MEFRIVVFGAHAAKEYIEGLGTQAANARPAFEEIYMTILDIEQEAFERQGARDGFPRWAPLAPATILWKIKRKLRPEILRATDRMMKAFTTYRSPDMVTRIEKDKIVFTPKSSAIPYARVHQEGYVDENSRRGSYGELPPRPPVRFSKSDQAAFAREIVRHITRRSGPGKIGIA